VDLMRLKLQKLNELKLFSRIIPLYPCPQVREERTGFPPEYDPAHAGRG